MSTTHPFDAFRPTTSEPPTSPDTPVSPDSLAAAHTNQKMTDNGEKAASVAPVALQETHDAAPVVEASASAPAHTDAPTPGQSITVDNVSTYVYNSDAPSTDQPLQSFVQSGSSQVVLENGEIAPGLHRLPLMGLACHYGAVVVAFLVISMMNLINMHGADKSLLSLITQVSVGVVVILIIAIQFAIKYYSFQWGITPDGLRIKEGIIVKKDMTIPFSKVHSLHLTEPLLMRFFGFVTVKIDTGASGFQAAHRIAALHRNEAEALQRDIFRYKQHLAAAVSTSAQPVDLTLSTGGSAQGELANEAFVQPVNHQMLDATTLSLAEQARAIHHQELTLAQETPRETSRLTQEVVKFDQHLRGLFAGRSITDADIIAQRSLSLAELFWSALLNVRIAAGVGAALAIATFISGIAGVQQWIDAQASSLGHTVELSASSSAGVQMGSLVPLVVGITVACLVVCTCAGVLLSYMQHVVSHANFNVQRTRSRINITAGLITRNSYAIAIERIQAFVVKQNLLQRIGGYATLQVVLLQGQDETSSKNGQEFKQDGKETIHPCIRLSEVPAFLDEYLPEYRATYEMDCAMTSLPSKALSRSLKRASYWSLVGAGVAAVTVLIILLALGDVWAVKTTSTRGPFIAAVIAFVVIFALQVGPRFLAWRQTKIGHTNDVLYVIKGIFELKRTTIYREKLQEIQVKQNPFQVRLDLARVCYRTAGHMKMSYGFVYDAPLSCAYDIYEWLRPHTKNDKLVAFALEQAGMNTEFVPQLQDRH